MTAIPESKHSTSAAIVRWYESKPQEHRPHMGASLIGHACDRSIWLTWRWALKPSFNGRILRLFDTGKREESRLVEELRGIGADVWDTNPETGDQWRVSAFNGHFGGSLDGVAKGLPEAPKSAAVLEFKTHSNKSYNDMAKKGVKESKPQHFDQMTIYMGLMGIDRAMYMAVNKDTDEVYAEWVHFDKNRFDVLMAKVETLIELTSAPERISEDAAYFVCKMCSFHKHCHGQIAAEANCRTCCHASPIENAAWSCAKHGKLSENVQRDGCKEHLMIPSLVPYGTPVDGGHDWIAYEHKETGKHFVNGPEPLEEYGPAFSSKELHNCPGPLIGEALAVKTDYPGSKVVPVSPQTVEELNAIWDPIATNPDDLEAMPSTRSKRKQRDEIKKSISALETLHERSDSPRRQTR